jgi:large conductance mechanosensitive channel
MEPLKELKDLKDFKVPKVKLIDDFKAFALKGNVMDMAVGIIIGAAFGKIVSSLVNDIIMPPIGLLVGGVNFTDLTVVMKQATDVAPAVTWNYGNFLQVVFDFLIVAWAVFMAIKGIASLKRKEEAPAAAPEPPAPTKEEVLLSEIRDLLKQSKK